MCLCIAAALRSKLRLVDDARLFERGCFGVLLLRDACSFALGRFQVVETCRFRIGCLHGQFQALEVSNQGVSGPIRTAEQVEATGPSGDQITSAVATGNPKIVDERSQVVGDKITLLMKARRAVVNGHVKIVTRPKKKSAPAASETAAAASRGEVPPGGAPTPARERIEGLVRRGCSIPPLILARDASAEPPVRAPRHTTPAPTPQD